MTAAASFSFESDASSNINYETDDGLLGIEVDSEDDLLKFNNDGQNTAFMSYEGNI